MDVSTGIALLAFLLSVLNYFHNKHIMIINALSGERMKWIHNVRFAVYEYVTACLNSDNNTILIKKLQLKLYLNPQNNEHKDLINSVDNYVVSENPKTHVENVVTEAQILLNKSWKRVKREAGVSKSFEIIRDRKI